MQMQLGSAAYSSNSHLHAAVRLFTLVDEICMRSCELMHKISLRQC